MHKYAVIVAAGSGTRFGGTVPKQFQEIRGKSLLWHSVNAFQKTFKDIRLIIVLPPGFTRYGDQLPAEFPNTKINITTGGGYTVPISEKWSCLRYRRLYRLRT